MTIRKIAVHDERLPGELPVVEGVLNIKVLRGQPLMLVLMRIRQAAQQAGGSVPHLEIYAHGWFAQPGDGPGAGQTILLSLERLHTGNAAFFGTMLQGKITQSIILSVCDAADQPNGATTCSLLARSAQVRVLASDATQNYSFRRTGFINVGVWEGRLFEFQPDGTSRHTFTGPNPVLP